VKRRRTTLLAIPVTLFSGVLLLAMTVGGCTHGLEPILEQPGFGGTIHFSSPWPPDSFNNVRVVAFNNYPPQNIINEILGGLAKVYPPITGSGLQTPADSVSYSFTLDSATVFKYVAVVMQDGSNIYADWKVIGAYGYSHGAGSPDSVTIPSNTYVNGINIDVDFANTPPTPPGIVASAASKQN